MTNSADPDEQSDQAGSPQFAQICLPENLGTLRYFSVDLIRMSAYISFITVA